VEPRIVEDLETGKVPARGEECTRGGLGDVFPGPLDVLFAEGDYVELGRPESGGPPDLQTGNPGRVQLLTGVPTIMSQSLLS